MWKINLICKGDHGEHDKACKKTFEVTENDVIKTMIGNNKYEFTVKCPNCGCKTVIPLNVVPDRVQKLAKEN